MKNIFSIAILSLFAFSLSAQETTRMFLNTTTAELLQRSANELQHIVDVLDKNLEVGDMSVATQNKGQLVRLMNSTSNTFYNLNESVQRNFDITKNPQNYKDDSEEIIDEPCYGFFELHITDKETNVIKSHADEIARLYDQIHDNAYSVHPKTKHAKENVFMFKQYVNTMQESLQILAAAKERT